MQPTKNQEKYKTTQNKGSDVKEIRVITKLPNSEQSYKMILNLNQDTPGRNSVVMCFFFFLCFNSDNPNPPTTVSIMIHNPLKIIINLSNVVFVVN